MREPAAARAQTTDNAREVGRQRRGERHRRARGRVDEAELRGVQGETGDLDRVALGLAVDGIAEHWMFQEREVDPDLVRAAGAELGLDERGRAERFDRPEHGVRRASAGARRERGAARARARAADAARHHDLAPECAAGEREVAALDGVAAELALQALGREVRERKHHDAGGVAVEPVHDVNPARAAAAAFDLRRRAAHSRVLLPVERRVGEQSRGLVDNQDVVVEEEHLDRGRAWRGDPSRQVGAVRDGVGRRNPAARVESHDAVDEHVANLNLTAGVRVRRAEHVLHDAGETPLVAGHARSLAPGGRPVTLGCGGQAARRPIG
jgi:hypothetical protein